MRFLAKRWPWLLLLIAVCAGFWRLRFDPEILELLPSDEPTVQGLKLYQEHFTNARELIITLRAESAETTEVAAKLLAEHLGAQTNLVESAAWQPPWLTQPEKLAEILACIWLNQPPAQFQTLSNKVADGNLGSTLRETKEALASSLSPMDLARRAFDPFDLLNLPVDAGFGSDSFERGERMFGSKDGQFRLVFVQAKPELADYRACAKWLEEMRGEVGKLRAAKPELRTVTVRYTGRPVFVNEVASGMQKDLGGSVTGTALIIALLFWIAHRRLLPMFWVLALLGFILAATIALGGLVFGGVKVISMAFAAVLLGLAVDYALVLYQEKVAEPGLSVDEVHRAVRPSIVWAAVTTICAFLTLNLGGLPGLAQLGTIVAIGVALAAWIMLTWLLPVLFRAEKAGSPIPMPEAAMGHGFLRASTCAMFATVAITLIALGSLAFRMPQLDATAKALQLQNSEAQAALDEMTREMEISSDALWLIASGGDEAAVREKLNQAGQLLRTASSNGVVTGWFLPTALWPDPANQRANLPLAAWLGRRGPALREAALREGFNGESLMMTDEMLRSWESAGRSGGTIWPTNEVSQWLLERAIAREPNAFHALGMVYPAKDSGAASGVNGLVEAFASRKVIVSGWGLLGSATLDHVRERAWRVTIPMALLVLLSLWFAFRSAREVLLGLASLALSGLILLAVMGLCDWSWNLLNLMALPLVLGTGVDYGIHTQLALRRHRGDLAMAWRSVGKALLLCGGTTIAGFGSLAWAGNAGIASLGKVCSVGIAANIVVAVCLLPFWWRRTAPGNTAGEMSAPTNPKIQSPSQFYGASVWRLGQFLVRHTPVVLLECLFLALAEVYYRINSRRRNVVIANLLPVVKGDVSAAMKSAHRLFREFALKLLALLRFESGVCDASWSTAGIDWATIEDAWARKKGVLLLTPHLGNWEIGGALLAQRGIKLVVLTQAEPGKGLTELRKEARARWGIETFVVGGDGFDFVEIIKRLNDGQNVALLIDRPPAAKAVMIEMFGRPFPASIAPAELARATGCAVLGVTVVHSGEGYGAKILPEFTYDRRALGQRNARVDFVQRIMRAFESEILAHPEQWFHFVPVWPGENSTKPSQPES